MKSKLKYLLWLPVALVVVVGFDALTVHEHYELESATVLKVLPNPKWGFIAQDQMTVVKFADGYVTNVGGYRGDPGDKIKVERVRGSETVLGIFPQRRW